MSVSGTILEDYTGTNRKLSVRTKLNIRNGPSRDALRVRRCEPPTILIADQLVDSDTFLDNSHWYREAGSGNFFWAGGVDPVFAAPELPQSTSLSVKRRADGSILPLNQVELATRYGQLNYQSNADGTITLRDNWELLNIVDFRHELLAQMNISRLRVHVKAEPFFRAAFDAIRDANPPVRDRMLTCGGAFYARHIGRDPKRPLSSHSWGVALDLNVAWNAYGSRPQVAGQIGSVQELVPYFAQFGFAWGGHFSGKSCDGMHFELALI